MPSTRRVLKVRVFKVLYKLEIENWIEISILQIPSKCMPVYIIKRFALDSISLVEYSVDIWNIFQVLTFENCSMVQQATGGIYSIYFNFHFVQRHAVRSHSCPGGQMFPLSDPQKESTLRRSFGSSFLNLALSICMNNNSFASSDLGMNSSSVSSRKPTCFF